MLRARTSPLTLFVGGILLASRKRPPILRYGVAIVLPLLAGVTTATLTHISTTPLFPLFSAAVVLTSVFGGVYPGLLTVVECAIINVLVVPPSWSIRVSSPDHLIRIGLFVFAGSAIALIVGLLGDLQNQLQIERSQLLITLRGIGDAVIATDEVGNVTFMNSVAEQATGWTAAEAMGVPLENIFHIVNEISRSAVENPVREVILTGCAVPLANHTLLIRKDGSEIPIDDSAAPIRDSQQMIVGVVLVFRDITRDRLSQAALMRADRLNVTSKLAATIAHEMNNPLEAVANLIYLVAQDDTLSPFSKAQIDQAQSELRRAIEGSRRMLSFRRVEREWKKVNLREIVDSVLNLYSTVAASRKVEFKNEIPPECSVTLLPMEMRQLVSNLVSNALDVMSHGGSLRISSSREDGTGVWKVFFSDTGSGIDANHLHSIFEPFFTTKNEYAAGLGLWIAKRIAEDHGGELEVVSDATGSTFTLILPANCTGSDRTLHDADTQQEALPTAPTA